ncbi:MAG: eukaryotic-like serine/threonine-protein kinase [Candidatus Poribacteria bacterium]|nr:eukaryotic-like serine/threonine-protein kinase [Candidatus Poribacteria bacterium]MDQ1329042.1 eukaryotic-like serine/threonine-protein kinase [Candidatus Poribacteria bacterium]
MRAKKFKAKSIVVIFLLLLPIYQVFAINPSPADGGWLEVSKPGGYAFAANHEDFGKNLIDRNEFTLEMWFYMKRDFRFGEVWVLLDKEGSYMLALRGPIFDSNGNRPIPLEESHIAVELFLYAPNGSNNFGASYTTKEELLNQWHHIVYVHDKNDNWFYIDGVQFAGLRTGDEGILDYTDDPLYIGGTTIDIDQRWNAKSLVQFSGGLIDEVRISDKVRYPVNGEIIAVSQGRFEPDENALALWHFDGDRTKWLKDASGHEHTLTAVNLNYYSVGVSGKLPTIWGQIKSN